MKTQPFSNRMNLFKLLLLLALINLYGCCSMPDFLSSCYLIIIKVDTTYDNGINIRRYFDEYMMAKSCLWSSGDKGYNNYDCELQYGSVNITFGYNYEHNGSRLSRLEYVSIENKRSGYKEPLKGEIDKLTHEIEIELEKIVGRNKFTIKKCHCP